MLCAVLLSGPLLAVRFVSKNKELGHQPKSRVSCVQSLACASVTSVSKLLRDRKAAQRNAAIVARAIRFNSPIKPKSPVSAMEDGPMSHAASPSFHQLLSIAGLPLPEEQDRQRATSEFSPPNPTPVEFPQRAASEPHYPEAVGPSELTFTPPSARQPAVRLFQTNQKVMHSRYATSADPRGYIPVYEYNVAGSTIMIDSETGYVHLTALWKALGHNKADVTRLCESDPSIAPLVRKVRGGYLKIQGTWVPFETALVLARRVAYPIRESLIPLFGPTFCDVSPSCPPD